MVLQVAVAQDQGGSVFNMLSLKVFRLLSQEERSSDMVWVCLERIVLEVSTWESLLGSRRMNEVAQEPIHSEERVTQGGALEGLCMPLLMAFITLYCHFSLNNPVRLQEP